MLHFYRQWNDSQTAWESGGMGSPLQMLADLEETS